VFGHKDAASMSSVAPLPAPADDVASNSDTDYSSSEDRPFSPPRSSSYVSHQRVTVDTELSSANKGYGLLLKMGWKGSGAGLGPEADGELALFRQTLVTTRGEQIC
jgi:hypothetical protein